MDESEKVLELYIKQQQDKINELAQQVLLLSTKNEYLQKLLEKNNKELQVFKDINSKNKNSVNGFKHKKLTKR